jgi:hypothetical protein
MIPTLILIGAIAGRWYVVALAAAAWPLVVIFGAGAPYAPDDLLAEAALGAANTAVGVIVHKALVGAVRAAVGSGDVIRRARRSQR